MSVEVAVGRGFEVLWRVGVFLPAIVISSFPLLVIPEQFLFVRGEIIVSLLGNEIMFVRQPKPFTRGIDKFRAALAVCFEGPLHFRDSFSNQSIRDDELRPPLVLPLRALTSF